jgi:zinc protease
MRKALGLLAAAVWFSASPAHAELDLERAEVTHLRDGLTVIMLEDHSLPVVSVQMLYKSGSAAEVRGKTGLAHFLEHLAFRASLNFPNESATEQIYDAGGEWHGYTAYDQTTYFSTMPRDGLDLLLKIEADRMARTVIDPASIEAEKGAVITEMHSYENDPVLVLQDSVPRTAIQAHPYGSPIIGYASDVERLTADDARAYYASHYAPGNAVLAIVGDFVPSQAKALVAKEFADVPARPVAEPVFTTEPAQRGQRRIELSGPVDRQYFLVAFPLPAASSPDFPAFLLLQEILAGGYGLNVQRNGWGVSPSKKGSALFGTSDDIASWVPPTRDPFLFMINGSIAKGGDQAVLERELMRRIALVTENPVSATRLDEAKASVRRALIDDVQTTEDAAHQLALFEGVGALDALLTMPAKLDAVTAAEVRNVARKYLRASSATWGWMVPGETPRVRPGAGVPRSAADRPGSPPSDIASGAPELRKLRGGLPAIVQPNQLSDTATVELLLSGPVKDGSSPRALQGMDAVIRSGNPQDVDALVADAVAASKQSEMTTGKPSDDPSERLQQLISAQTGVRGANPARPVAAIVSGKVEPGRVFEILQQQLGSTAPAKLPSVASAPAPSTLRVLTERIPKPLSQAALGYVVEGPPLSSKQAWAWRLLLYVLTHDYSGRLGRSAIKDKGIVYHIYSDFRTDGGRTWATVSTGVDPDKSEEMEAELRAQLAGLVSQPPSPAELDAARNHFLGRDISAAQSNDELTAKLAREFVETGGLRSHEQLRAQLMAITPGDLAAATRAFASGTIIRVDVGNHP